MRNAIEILEARLLGDSDWLDVEELGRLCDLSLEMMTELVDLGVAPARGGASRELQVPATALPRLRIASRLIHDLGVNVSGAALALELLEMQRELERRVRELERLANNRG
jgi:chaperone modulatory protein CbpM